MEYEKVISEYFDILPMPAARKTERCKEVGSICFDTLFGKKYR